MWNSNDPYRSSVMYPGDPRRSRSSVRAIAAYVNWEIVAVFVILLGFFSFVLLSGNPVWQVPGTIGLVVVGWVFSLCLHEFAHAATAYLGGDHSDTTASYLSFNPLKYVHPVLSIVMPIVFLLLGFIALPGGAVYLQRGLVRSRGWQSAISFAGPLMNLLCLGIIAVPFTLGVLDTHFALAVGLATLAFFQVAAFILNMLPVPGLDGYGIIEPWLSYNVRATLAPFYGYAIFVIFLLLWFVPLANTLYFTAVEAAMLVAHISPFLVNLGIFNFLHI